MRVMHEDTLGTGGIWNYNTHAIGSSRARAMKPAGSFNDVVIATRILVLQQHGRLTTSDHQIKLDVIFTNADLP